MPSINKNSDGETSHESRDHHPAANVHASVAVSASPSVAVDGSRESEGPSSMNTNTGNANADSVKNVPAATSASVPLSASEPASSSASALNRNTNPSSQMQFSNRHQHSNSTVSTNQSHSVHHGHGHGPPIPYQGHQHHHGISPLAAHLPHYGSASGSGPTYPSAPNMNMNMMHTNTMPMNVNANANVNRNIKTESSMCMKMKKVMDVSNSNQESSSGKVTGHGHGFGHPHQLHGQATRIKKEAEHIHITNTAIAAITNATGTAIDKDTVTPSKADQLPRRILQFEPSPNSNLGQSHVSSGGVERNQGDSSINPTGAAIAIHDESRGASASGGINTTGPGSASPGKMDPLDGNHSINLLSNSNNPNTASGAEGGGNSSGSNVNVNVGHNLNQGSGGDQHGHAQGQVQGQGHSQYHHALPNHGYPQGPGSIANPGQGSQGQGHGPHAHAGYPPPPSHHHPTSGHPYPPQSHYNYNYGHGHPNAPPPPQASYDYYNPSTGGVPAPLHQHSQQQHPQSHQHQPSSNTAYPSPSPKLGLKTSSHSPRPASGSSGVGVGLHGQSQTPGQGNPSHGHGTGTTRYDPYPHSHHGHGHSYVKEESHMHSQHGQQQQSSSQPPAFQPTPPFDRMPLMDIHGNSDSKNFEDLMVSPSTGLSSRGGGDKRRVPYDLHDQPAFNEQHNSPITIRRNSSNASATRYCTPIVTGGNDRSRVTSVSSFNLLNSSQSEQNYRPSPPQGGRYDDYDSHMRYYHRPYPTMRGGQPSPTRYDDQLVSSQLQSQAPPPSDHRYGHPGHGSSSYAPGSSPAYATPVFPRGGAGAPIPPTESSSGGMRNSSGSSGSHNHASHSHSHAKYPTPTPYYDHHGHVSGMPAYPPHAPHSNPAAPYPRHDAPYPPPHTSYMGSGTSPYGTHPPPPYPGQGYPSPYDPHGYPNPHGHMPYPHDYHRNAVEKKRRRNDSGARKAPKPPKRKKMYSDFVGVTYNKTHAKFQACITHYRKQHYLGRYKLACDAAKAYDQSAKLLKGNGWKINFQSEDDYQAAKEKEFREVEEKRQGSGIDSHTLRKAYEATFPTEAALREKLGLQPKPQQQHAVGHPLTMAMPMQQVGSMVGAYSGSLHSQGEYQHRDPMIQQQQHVHRAPVGALKPVLTAQTPSAATAPVATNTGTAQPTPSYEVTTTMAAPSAMEQSLGQPAVTPSPNLQNLNKSSTLMKEPLMSPGFATGASPSANSLLGSTPFSMPESSIKFHSAVKQTSENKRDLDMITSNIFQSPKEKMAFSTSEIPTEAASLATPSKLLANVSANDKETAEAGGKTLGSEKGKGDLAAASALLTIARPN